MTPKLYHGSACKTPFTSFDTEFLGTGVTTQGRGFIGFFLSSDIETAWDFADRYVAVCEIDGDIITRDDLAELIRDRKMTPSEALIEAYEKEEVYMLPDILDGFHYSDVFLVPHGLEDRIRIIEWIDTYEL